MGARYASSGARVEELTGGVDRASANKRLVFDMWRGIINAGHVELADELLAEGYIQHSPLLPTGRAGFKQVMSVIPRRDQVPDLIEPPIIAMVAEGDLVAMTFIEELPVRFRRATHTAAACEPRCPIGKPGGRRVSVGRPIINEANAPAFDKRKAGGPL